MSHTIRPLSLLVALGACAKPSAGAASASSTDMTGSAASGGVDTTPGPGTADNTSANPSGDPTAGDAVSGAATDASDTTSDPSGGPVPPIDECTVAAPEWIFCDSFEAGGTWDGSVTNPTLLEDDGPFGLAGNHAAQLRVPPGSGGSGLYKDLALHDALYVRFYVMWEPGHDFTAPRHGPGGLHGGNTDCVGCSGSQPMDWFTSTLENVTAPPHTLQAYTYYPGMYMDCADPNGSCWGDMFPCTAGPSYCTNPDHAPDIDAPEMVAGQWYCLEQFIDGGTPSPSGDDASGVLNFWIDELEIGPWPELWLRASPDVQLSAVWLYLFHHAEHSEEGLLLDNIVVSTARIGCPGPS